MNPSESPVASAPRTLRRVRHALQVRRLNVQRCQRLSPHFVRVVLGGAELQGFVSASFDDHVKLMLPATPGAELVLPRASPDGLELPEGAPRPVMRDYTPRHHDAAADELHIDFALHGDAPAASWAAQATPGQAVGIGGPRGSFVVPLDWDWHLLIGDETALPAIARRLEELPADATAVVLVETGDVADRLTMPSRAEVRLQWLQRGRDLSLAEATRRLQLPGGEGYAWAAGEAAAIAATRQVMVEAHGLPKERIRAASYWKRGAVAHHGHLDT
jgi:NADPH-dependent ferric siderophore reductase